MKGIKILILSVTSFFTVNNHSFAQTTTNNSNDLNTKKERSTYSMYSNVNGYLGMEFILIYPAINVGVDIVNGVNIKDVVCVGAGIGLENSFGERNIPVFLDFQVIPYKDKISPVLGLRYGVDFHKATETSGQSLLLSSGLAVRKENNNIWTFKLSAKVNDYGPDQIGFRAFLSVGFTFN